MEITCEYKLLMLWSIAGNLAESDDHNTCPSFGRVVGDHWAHLQTQEEKKLQQVPALEHSCASTQAKISFLNIFWLKCVVMYLKDKKFRNRFLKKAHPNPASVMLRQKLSSKGFFWLIPSVLDWLFCCCCCFSLINLQWIKGSSGSSTKLSFWDNPWRS